jgi:arylsulfatase A-like enzyme
MNRKTSCCCFSCIRAGNRVSVLAFIVFMAVSSFALGGDTGVPSLPRLVLVYATCSVNENYLAPYNSRVAYTPHLREFAEHARVFARHQTEAEISGIAFASLWTGTQAMRHGIYSHPEWLDDSNYLMAEAYAERGYETYFWNAHGLASAGLNYGQGVKPEHITSRMLTGDDPGFAKLLDRLKKDPNLRAFVMTNHTVRHRGYEMGSMDGFCARYPAE